MITDIEDYFSKGCGRCPRFDTPDCSTAFWSQGLHDLRRICRDAGLIELVKWGHPCYMHVGRNIVIIGAFRDNFRLTFFNAALMQDPAGIMEKQGPNTRQPDMIRFTDAAQVTDAEPLLQSYLTEAMGYARAGIRAVRAVGLANGAKFLARMFPPDLGKWDVLSAGIFESLQMAVLSSAAGILLSLPIGLMAARNLMPSALT